MSEVAVLSPGIAPAAGPRTRHLHVVSATAPVRSRPRPAAATYRRRRLVAAGLLLAIALAIWVALGALGDGPLPVPERPLGEAATYVVQPGDTMWSIAQRLDPTGDPRPIVHRLVAAHGGATIHVGEVIPLPRP